MEKEKKLPYFELTSTIMQCCFEVMKELGPGFLERIYKNALLIAMKQKGLQVEVEQPFTLKMDVPIARVTKLSPEEIEKWIDKISTPSLR